ncbi:hypothetical protein QYM36_004416 [Artemia franciscana]|uniref:Otopetrin-2 n=2 Tax=Artemia franciscana TaxID=6661 RepID=A0AA88I2R2_ARTSF|nr:hypothetical protein QYM36_004416 [Artemia franciscana]
MFKPLKKVSLILPHAIRRGGHPLAIEAPRTRIMCEKETSETERHPSGSSAETNSVDKLPNMECPAELTLSFLETQGGTLYNQKKWQKEGDRNLMMVISSLYGLMLVVLGLSFPVSSVVSSTIPFSYYDGFYVYLYTVAIIFLIYVYTTVKKISLPSCGIGKKFRRRHLESIASAKTQDSSIYHFSFRNNYGFHDTSHHRSSFYLRVGSVVFGIGSLIYSGLDFGQNFEIREDSSCQKLLRALSPLTKSVFTFIQMYFIFLNSKIFRKKYPSVASFGLMHLVATNLCVWLNVIVQETKHEILEFLANHDPSTDGQLPYKLVGSLSHDSTQNNTAIMNFHGNVRHKRGSLEDECRRTNIVGSIIQDASPFLFPCAIEYSLLCAAFMYEMWKTGVPKKGYSTPGTPGDDFYNGIQRSSHQYSADCTSANKGLFAGILVLVLSIISTIMFFVLINKEDYKSMAVLEINIAELSLYILMFFATILGIFQVRKLKFHATRKLGLDKTLLAIALTGVMIYNSFTVIGSYFDWDAYSTIVLVTALMDMIQSSAQTIFILDASNRSTYTQEQQVRKPGREITTFLLVSNVAMWVVKTLEKSRSDAHPIQYHFFGLWPWTIITNVFMPLAIFFRYHSTVCFFEIWKRCYKMKFNDVNDVRVDKVPRVSISA